MFKIHNNSLTPIESEPLTFQDYEQKENTYVSVRKPARLKLAPKENFNLEKLINAGVDLKQVNCKILEPKEINLQPKTKKSAFVSKTEQTTLKED